MSLSATWSTFPRWVEVIQLGVAWHLPFSPVTHTFTSLLSLATCWQCQRMKWKGRRSSLRRTRWSWWYGIPALQSLTNILYKAIHPGNRPLPGFYSAVCVQQYGSLQECKDKRCVLKHSIYGTEGVTNLCFHTEMDTVLGDTQCEIQGEHLIGVNMAMKDSRFWFYAPVDIIFISQWSRNKLKYSDITFLGIFLPLSYPLDHETAVMHQLQEVILAKAGSLIRVMDLSAELDWWAPRSQLCWWCSS